MRALPVRAQIPGRHNAGNERLRYQQPADARCFFGKPVDPGIIGHGEQILSPDDRQRLRGESFPWTDIWMKNIKLGPSLPAFVSPDVLRFLAEQFQLGPTGTPQEDLDKLLAS